MHNDSLLYEEDILPIPDLNGTSFSKSDALALGKFRKCSFSSFVSVFDLATFYSIAMPHMTYGIISHVVDLPINTLHSIDNSKNDLNMLNATTDETRFKKSNKRKATNENDENELDET